MPPPFLSIAMAVYQRWHELSSVLDVLLPQLDGETELVISDNASPNGMADKIQERCAGIQNVRLIRQQSNVGPLLNFKAAFEACRGEFILCLADDDLPSANFISFVKSTLRAYPKAGVYHFDPNPAPERPLQYRVAEPGLDAMRLIFSHSAMMPGLAFPRRLFAPELWSSEPDIYPQVFLATTLAREFGSVLASGPEGLALGGQNDTAVNRARSRPDDFGIAERLKHLVRAGKVLPPAEQKAALNHAVHELLVWGWSVYEEMMSEDKRVAHRYISALVRIPYVYASPRLLRVWLGWVVWHPRFWGSARYVLPAVFKGLFPHTKSLPAAC